MSLSIMHSQLYFLSSSLSSFLSPSFPCFPLFLYVQICLTELTHTSWCVFVQVKAQHWGSVLLFSCDLHKAGYSWILGIQSRVLLLMRQALQWQGCLSRLQSKKKKSSCFNSLPTFPLPVKKERNLSHQTLKKSKNSGSSTLLSYNDY